MMENRYPPSPFSGDGYHMLKKLNDGRLIGTAQMLFTAGLFVGIDEHGNYEERYCYPSLEEAEIALKWWDGAGDPPGMWIVNKPSGRQGPGGIKKYSMEF